MISVLTEDFAAKLERFLATLTDEAMAEFSDAVINFRKWPENDHLSRFLRDVELSWYSGTHAVGEW